MSRRETSRDRLDSTEGSQHELIDESVTRRSQDYSDHKITRERFQSMQEATMTDAVEPLTTDFLFSSLVGSQDKKALRFDLTGSLNCTGTRR